MRKLSGILAACALLFAIASTAQAKTVEWRGTQIFVLGAAVGPISTGTGVATVNGSGGLGHLSTLRVAGGISGSTTIPTTDPAITVIRLATGLGTGTLAPISGGGPLLPPNRTLPITGTFSMGVRVAPGFTVPLVLPLTVN